MGLKVFAPQQRNHQSANNDEMFYINQELMNQVYDLYKEYISNFGPNLN